MTIVCLGEAMVEERVPADGPAGTRYGGDTLNTAVHLARYGHDVAYATAMGQDPKSRQLVDAWRQEGVDSSFVLEHPDRTVGRYRITVDEAGERSFSYDRSKSAARAMFTLDAAGQWEDGIARADLLYFSLISLAILPEDGRARLLALAGRVRARGGRVAFDSNYRPALWECEQAARDWQAGAISKADIGLPTLDDEIALNGAGDAAEVANRWAQRGCSETTVKTGSAGCLIPGGILVPPEAPIAPVDTSGAGDAFNAGYLAGRLSGKEPLEASRLAHRLAGWTILRRGAIPPHDAQAPY